MESNTEKICLQKKNKEKKKKKYMKTNNQKLFISVQMGKKKKDLKCLYLFQTNISANNFKTSAKIIAKILV